VKKEPEIDPVLEFALKYRAGLNFPGEKFPGLVTYAFVHDDNASKVFSGGCYATFPTNFRAYGNSSKYLITQTNPKYYVQGEEGMPLIHRYVDYLINRSIFAEAFVHKDAEDSWKNGYVLDMSLPAQIVISAAIYARYAREQWRWVADFNACLDAGIPEDEAFVAMMFYRKAPKGEDVQPTTSFAGHTVLMQGSFTKKGFENLLNKTYSETVIINDVPCSENPNYKGIAQLFCGSGYDLEHPKYPKPAKGVKEAIGMFKRNNIYSVSELKLLWEMFKAHNLPKKKKGDK